MESNDFSWKDAWKKSPLKAKIFFIAIVATSFIFFGNTVFYVFYRTGAPDFIESIIASLAGGVVLAVMAFFILKGDMFPTDTGGTTQERITNLIEALEKSTELISAIEQETKDRQQLVEKLEQDLATYDELVKLQKPEVEAVAQLLRGELRKEGKRGLLQEILVNGFFFLLGVALTIITGIGGP